MSDVLEGKLAPQPKLFLRVAVVAVLALCVAAAFLPLLGAGWVYDDVNLVKPSPALKDLAGLGQALTTDLYRQAAPRLEASSYWRPLALVSYWLDTRFGTPPFSLHLGSLILHALAAVLLALVIMRRHAGTMGLLAAVGAAAWWAFHPENVETVAWISCRYDLLCGVALLCLLVIPWRPGPLGAAFYGLVFLAGLFSKEGFIAMVVVVAAMDFSEQRPVASVLWRWGAVVLALVIWGVLRTIIGIRSFDLPSPVEVFAIIRIYLETIAIYFGRAFAVLPLTISHPYAAEGAAGLIAGLVLFAILVLIALRQRRVTVPIAIFLAGLIPVAGAISMFHEAPERYFYIPSIGLALLAGELLRLALSARHLSMRIAIPVAFGIVVLFGFVRLEQRLPDWHNDDTLWAAALRVNPLDPQANLNQSIAAGRRGDWEEARRAIGVAAQQEPDSGRIASTYAWVLIRTNDFASAVREAERAAALAPYQPDCWYYLAFAQYKNGDYAGSFTALEKLLQIAPDYPGARAMHETVAREMNR